MKLTSTAFPRRLSVENGRPAASISETVGAGPMSARGPAASPRAVSRTSMRDSSIPRPLERPEIEQPIEEEIRVEKRESSLFPQTIVPDDPLIRGREARSPTFEASGQLIRRPGSGTPGGRFTARVQARKIVVDDGFPVAPGRLTTMA